ncbi:AMP-binding protein [Qaidamihabitans albus]|uniref:AMP-binding protein n=1 Tax=Qaidamihabitans albus TaxID=2795733 RepID=UPI0018F143C5|nr:AMP-binding protein [Qaidamihabitans albus]
MATPRVEIVDLDDGARVMRSRIPLGGVPDTIFSWLDRWAAERPDAAFVTEPVPKAQRRVLTYAAARAEVERLASDLALRGVAPGDRVVLAVPNSIRHLLWGLAVMRRGAVYVPMAPQYIGPGHDQDKLLGLLDMLDPALVVCPPGRCPAVPARWASADLASLDASAGAASSVAVPPVPGPDAIAKILLTSGSTGLPKPVPYPHRLMTAAMVMTLQVWTFVHDEPPVLLDWLPWNHAFGGTANLHLVLASGGTLHIDAGGPSPSGVEATLADVAVLRPNLFFAVPATLDLVRQRLEDDERSRTFFSSVRMIFSAGAALSADTYDALKRLADRCGYPVVITSGWGGTETGPGATLLQVTDGGPGWIGTPLPGVEVKLSPEAGKFHSLVRGPNVFSGYWGPASRPDAFDTEGFYRTGDAVCLVDPARPELGLRFDGRLADDFKLANGTWVDYARVRTGFLEALEGRVVDLVVGLPDGPALAALAWTADGEPLPTSSVDEALARYNAAAPRPSERIVALGTLRTPPTAEEVGSKGQLRPTEVRRARRGEFDALLGSRTPA